MGLPGAAPVGAERPAASSAPEQAKAAGSGEPPAKATATSAPQLENRAIQEALESDWPTRRRLALAATEAGATVLAEAFLTGRSYRSIKAELAQETDLAREARTILMPPPVLNPPPPPKVAAEVPAPGPPPARPKEWEQPPKAASSTDTGPATAAQQQQGAAKAPGRWALRAKAPRAKKKD